MRALMRVHAMELALEPVFERSLRRVVAETMKANRLGPVSSLPGLTAAIQAPEPSPDRLKILLVAWQREVDQYIAPAMLTAFRKAAAFTLGRLPGDLPAVFGPNVRDVRAASWLGRIRNRLVGIGDTAYQEATEALRVSLETGEGIAKAADRVRESLGVTLRRAETIARTEAAAVVNGADASISAELAEAGLEHAREWLSTGDPRTRETHRSANGQVVQHGEKFVVGGAALAYPGDPEGPAGEVINCRCTTLIDLPDE